MNAGYKFEDKKTTITLDEIEDLLDSDFGGLTAISEAIGKEMEAVNAPETNEGSTGKK